MIVDLWKGLSFYKLFYVAKCSFSFSFFLVSCYRQLKMTLGQLEFSDHKKAHFMYLTKLLTSWLQILENGQGLLISFCALSTYAQDSELHIYTEVESDVLL